MEAFIVIRGQIDKKDRKPPKIDKPNLEKFLLLKKYSVLRSKNPIIIAINPIIPNRKKFIFLTPFSFLNFKITIL